tara:strand:- start:1052 stop:1546 length:495 start_codon:yes stop_codon:yes gene_type:complete
MINNLCKKYDIFMFDLDRTVFDTYSKSGEPIWAKQMIQPLVKLNEDSVKDDCESECHLQPGIRSVLEYLKLNNKKVGFISRGGVHRVHFDEQPSILLLKMFDIYDYFSYVKFLFYKTEVKAGHLSQFGKCVFFDDMDKDLDEAKKIDGVKVIDRKGFEYWGDLL